MQPVNLRAARANPVFGTEKASVPKTGFWIKTKTAWFGFIHDRRLCTDGFSSVHNR
jgi:hypothetical protein